MTTITPSPNKSSMSAEVADKIRDAIINATFDFGEALSEENLAAAFDVSRTPIREALNLLQLEGLVTIVPKSGTYVFTPSLADIVELCEYRAGLELQAAELAMLRHPMALAVELDGLLREMTLTLQTGDLRRYGQLDTQYHQTFMNHAGNRYLAQGYRMISGRVATLRTQLALHAKHEPKRSLHDHALMVQLIRENKTARLKATLWAHIMRTSDNFTRAFEDNPIKPLTQKEVLRRKLQQGGAL